MLFPRHLWVREKNNYIILLSVFMFAGCQDLVKAENDLSGIVYCSEGSPASFNPQLDTSGTTVDASSHQIYERLLNFDPLNGEIVPGLATSWLVSEDGLTYTFQLRKQVAFHTTPYFTPSRTLDADDILFSINRWRLPEHSYHNVSGGEYPYFNSVGLDKLIKDVNRVNGYRVEIVLNHPESSFLANLATDFAIILSAEYGQVLEQQNNKELIDTKPIGTGPYKLVRYRQDSFIRYVRHKEHWGPENKTEQLIFDITPSNSLRLAKLMTGECDAMAFPAHSELGIIRQREDLRLHEKPGLNVGFWAFNTSKAPFDNPQVRLALAMAIDRNALLEAIYFGSAVPASNIIPPTSWAYQADLKTISYNPIAAKKLLQENDIPDGFLMNIWAMPVERSYNPNAMKMAELIQRYLKEVGIQVNIVSYEWATFRARLKEGSHDSVLIGWSADNSDPDNFYRPLLSCSAIDSGTNRAKWCNQEYDALIDKALKYTNQEERAYFYVKANELLVEKMPLVPIAHAMQYQAYRKNLKGLEINPYGGINFGAAEKY
ncbi:MAG: cationic peptide transport system substrate-binding protein [Paraglaciecola sp.]|jgi:cationic peptide transport system substrate-binding protein